MTTKEYVEEIRYELCNIKEQAIYLSNIYGDKNFLYNLTEERFIAIDRIFIIQNYQSYAQAEIMLKESIGSTHLYHQTILDSFENIYVSHRKFIGQDF